MLNSVILASNLTCDINQRLIYEISCVIVCISYLIAAFMCEALFDNVKFNPCSSIYSLQIVLNMALKPCNTISFLLNPILFKLLLAHYQVLPKAIFVIKWCISINIFSSSLTKYLFSFGFLVVYLWACLWHSFY